jgi:uncharacterized protein YecT (DUF1311 family)
MILSLAFYIATLASPQGFCEDPNMTPHMCGDAAFKKAEAELNAVYSQALKAVDGDERKLLVDAQRKWLAFRDADCKAEFKKWEGGSGAALYTCTA